MYKMKSEFFECFSYFSCEMLWLIHSKSEDFGNDEKIWGYY